jgi:hypothetical protein
MAIRLGTLRLGSDASGHRSTIGTVEGRQNATDKADDRVMCQCPLSGAEEGSAKVLSIRPSALLAVTGHELVLNPHLFVQRLLLADPHARRRPSRCEPDRPRPEPGMGQEGSRCQGCTQIPRTSPRATT